MISYEDAWWTLRTGMRGPLCDRDAIMIDGLEFPAGGSKIYVPEALNLEYGYSGVTVELRLGRTRKYDWSIVWETPIVEIRWRRWERDGKWTRYPLGGDLSWIAADAFTSPYDQVYPPAWLRELVDDNAPQRWLVEVRRRDQIHREKGHA